MIAQLTGEVLSAGASWVVVDVHGVAFRVLTNPSTAAAARVGEPTTLHTSLIVREDSLSMWGFATDAEREAFEIVQGASGVGPKVAGAMLSVLTPAEIRQAISAGDVRRLTAVPGIGPKGAQKMVIELKDKVLVLAGTDDAVRPSSPTGDARWRAEVTEGLEGLGWSAKEAEKACDAVAPLVDEDPDIPLGRLMRAALGALAKR